MSAFQWLSYHRPSKRQTASNGKAYLLESSGAETKLKAGSQTCHGNVEVVCKLMQVGESDQMHPIPLGSISLNSATMTDWCSRIAVERVRGNRSRSWRRQHSVPDLLSDEGHVEGVEDEVNAGSLSSHVKFAT